MDRLVSVDVKELEINFRPSQRCTSAAFRITNLMHTMFVAVHVSTNRPSVYSFSPAAAVVLPPLSSTVFSLLLSASDLPPISLPPDSVLVRSSLLPTGKCSAAAVLRLFSLPGVKIFRDASLPIFLLGPHLLPALLLLPNSDSAGAGFLLSKSIAADSHAAQLPDLLCRSAAAGNSTFVAALLRAGADFSARGGDGKTPLSLAVASGSAAAVKSLLDAGARPDPANDRPVHISAAADRTDLIALLSSAIPDWANAIDFAGRTPLHAAAGAAAFAAVRMCLDSGGGDPDLPDARGWTPLHCAASAGAIEVAELLIDRSAYNAKLAVTLDGGRKTPSDLAADNGHPRLDLSDALHAAARGGDVEGVRELLSQGAEVESRDQNGWTALHRAAFKGRVEVMRALIGHGARVDAADDAGYTPLRCAVEAGRAEAALCLVAHGARAGVKGMKAAAELFSPVSRFLDSCCAVELGDPLTKLKHDIVKSSKMCTFDFLPHVN